MIEPGTHSLKVSTGHSLYTWWFIKISLSSLLKWTSSVEIKMGGGCQEALKEKKNSCGISELYAVINSKSLW